MKGRPFIIYIIRQQPMPSRSQIRFFVDRLQNVWILKYDTVMNIDGTEYVGLPMHSLDVYTEII